MTGTQLDIEKIVREVIHRLQQEEAVDRGNGGEKVPPPSAPKDSASVPRAQANSVPRRAKRTPNGKRGLLRLDEHVVTLTLLDGKLNGIRCVEVSPGAVLTPSVRDELRKKRIKLERADATGAATDSAGNGAPRLSLAAVTRSFDPGSLLDALAADHASAEQIVSDCVFEATRRVVECITDDGRIGVILTTRPVTAVCMANRQLGVRAAWAAEAESVQEAVDGIGANLLVVNPRSYSHFALRAVVRNFVNGNHDCPASVARFLEPSTEQER